MNPRHAMRQAFCHTAALIMGWWCVADCRGAPPAPADAAPAGIIAQAQACLAADEAALPELLRPLAEYRGDWEAVIRALEQAEPRAWTAPTPSLQEQEFARPGLQGKHPNSRLFFQVPANYTPAAPAGLLIFMHGGGAGSPLDAGLPYLGNHRTVGLAEHLAKFPYIVVTPSAPVSTNSSSRWNLPETETYLEDVISECRYRFNLDPDRVALGGFSMGGFGAWMQCERFLDKIAAGFIGGMGTAYLDINYRAFAGGAPLFVVFGQYDGFVEQMEHFHGPGVKLPDEQRPPRDLSLAGWEKLALRRFQEYNIPLVFKWHQGGHTMRGEAAPAMEIFFDWVQAKKRDPFHPRTVVVSPGGVIFSGKISQYSPVLHKRWCSILELAGGRIGYDLFKIDFSLPWRPRAMETYDEYRQRHKFIEKRVEIAGGWVDVEYQGDNVFEAETENVKRFSLWLHPAMVDFARPVTVRVNGQALSFRDLKPNLPDALRSYRRRRDWRLIYPCEIIVECPAAAVVE